MLILILILTIILILNLLFTKKEKYDPDLQNKKSEISGNLISGTVYGSEYEYVHPGITWVL